MGGLGIKVEPFDPDGEGLKIKIARRFENWFYRDISKNEIVDFEGKNYSDFKKL